MCRTQVDKKFVYKRTVKRLTIFDPLNYLGMKLYPDSKVELSPFISKNYDLLMQIGSFGKYKGFIERAIAKMDIQAGDHILDMGCGTGKNACLMNKYLTNKEEAKLIGVDISEIMGAQFGEMCADYPYASFVKQRIDQPFDLGAKFDKIFISFVIHGFPHEIRKTIILNAWNHLREGGTFNILDFAEFDMDAMPALHRFVFKKVECKYAFDFLEKDWKNILSGYGFKDFKEDLFFKNYVRLLRAVK